jgi:hypothetical protein
MQDLGEGPAFRFADEEMDVLGHDHISADKESVPLANALECVLEDVAGARVGQERVTVMTAESQEVETLCLLEPLE